MPGDPRGEFHFDSFHASASGQFVTRGGTPVELAPRLLQILFLLLERHPNVVEREELRQALWPDSVVEETALAQNIYLLRKALGTRPDGGEYIQTVPKRGYRFLGEVRRQPLTQGAPEPEGASPRWKIALGIAALVAAGLALAPSIRRSTAHEPNPEARRLFEQGRRILKQRRPDGAQATGLLRRAVELDPAYPEAYAALAESLATDQPPATEARKLIAQALDRFPNSAPVHAVAGFIAMVHEWDWKGAEFHFQRAMDLDPQAAQGKQWYALWMALMGRDLEAMQLMDAALKADPASPNLLADRCRLLYFQKRMAEATASCNQALEIESTYHFAHDSLLLIHLHERNAARAAHHAVRRLEHMDFAGHTEVERVLTRAAEEGGSPAVARTILDRGWFDYEPYYVAMLHGILGEREQALRLLEGVVERHSFFSFFVPIETAFSDLHGDPRFQTLRRRMGLPPA